MDLTYLYCVQAEGRWLLWYPMRTWSPHSVAILPWAHGSSLLSFHVASWRNQGREETACVWVYLLYTGGKWLGCPDPGDWKCFWIHQFRQASGWFYDNYLVWQWESSLCRFKTWATPQPCLHLSQDIQALSSIQMVLLDPQQKWPSSTILSLSLQLVPVTGDIGWVGAGHCLIAAQRLLALMVCSPGMFGTDQESPSHAGIPLATW